MPNGKIQPEHVVSLKTIGKWLKTNGETIYGTTQGPIAPNKEMVSTLKGNTVYLHILDENRDLIFIKDFKGKIKNMQFYKSKVNVSYKLNNYGIFIEIPDDQKDAIDTIIEITLK